MENVYVSIHGLTKRRRRRTRSASDNVGINGRRNRTDDLTTIHCHKEKYPYDYDDLNTMITPTIQIRGKPQTPLGLIRNTQTDVTTQEQQTLQDISDHSKLQKLVRNIHIVRGKT